MENSKKNNAIVFIMNLQYRFALAEMLVNLQKTNAGLYDDIVIYHSDLSEEDIRKFLLIEPKCIFKRYTYEQWEQDYKKPTAPKVVNFIKRYSYLTYVKYRVFELLEQYHKILYLDLDMLILDDISELFEIRGVAWRRAVLNFGQRMNKDIDMNKYSQWFSVFSNDNTYPNSGLLYISDEGIDWKQCLKDGHTFLMEFMDYIGGAVDELTISWIVHKNGIPLTLLDRKKYNTLLVWHSFETKIPHFMGSCKVWNNEFLQTVFPEWMENYKIAMKKASFESEAVIEFKETCVKKRIYEEVWMRLLSKSDFNVPEALTLQYDFSKNILSMKYKTNIVYEIGCNFYEYNFYVGLKINDKNLLVNQWFVEKIKNIAAQYKESDKELYVYTNKKSFEDISKEFKKFYESTIKYVCQYLELPSNSSNDVIIEPFLILNKEIEKLNVGEYFKIINSFPERYAVLISCRDECSKYFDEFLKETSLPLSSVNNRESYIAIISNGNKIVEKKSNNKINFSFHMNLKNPLWITMISEGYRFEKERSSIIINNIEYSINRRGLNFVIIDRLRECVVDFFNIDTYADKDLAMYRSEEMIQEINRMNNEMVQIL